jgi:hypothetical protein
MGSGMAPIFLGCAGFGLCAKASAFKAGTFNQHPYDHNLEFGITTKLLSGGADELSKY